MIDAHNLWKAIEPYALALIHRSTARGCRVISSVGRTIPSGALTALEFDTVINDTDGCWDAGQPKRLVAQRDGFYTAGGGFTFDAANNTVAARMGCAVRSNGATYHGRLDIATIAGRQMSVSAPPSGMIWLAAGQYVEIMALQDQGADRTTMAATATVEYQCYGFLERVG